MQCDIRVSPFALVGLFSAGATVLRNRSLRDLASGAGRKGSLTLVPYHCFCKAEFGRRCVHLVEYINCFLKES